MSRVKASLPFLFALLGISLAVSISGSLVMGALLLIICGVHFVKQKSWRRWERSPLDIPLLIFFIWGIAVTLINCSASLRKAASAQSAFLMFFLIAHGSRKEDVKTLIRWFCIASGVAGLLGLIQVMTGLNYIPALLIYRMPDFFTGWPEWAIHYLSPVSDRAVGFRSHPLTYAEGLAPVFLFVSAILIQIIRRKIVPARPVWLLWVIWGLVGIGIILAQGRAVWLGVGVGCLLLIPSIPSRFRWKIVAGGIILGILMLLLMPGFRGRLLSSFHAHMGQKSDQFSKDIRFQLWSEAIREFRKKPVAGVGLRGVALEFKTSVPGGNRPWSEAHNAYLQVTLERGLIGLALLIWILISAWRIIWALPLPWRWASVAIFSVFLIAGLTESWMKDKEIGMIFWAFMGCCELFRQKSDKVNV